MRELQGRPAGCAYLLSWAWGQQKSGKEAQYSYTHCQGCDELRRIENQEGQKNQIHQQTPLGRRSESLPEGEREGLGRSTKRNYYQKTQRGWWNY